MPKINAASIVEHRENQRIRLLDVAREILVKDGPQAVTPGAVAKVAGISRPAVYQYFESGTAMIEHVVLDDFDESIAAIESAVDTGSDARTRAHAYVENVINQAAQGMHLTATALANFPMPESFKREINALHRKQIEPFIGALRDLGVTNHVQMALLGGIVETGVKLAESGMPAETVIEGVCSQLDSAIGPFQG